MDTLKACWRHVTKVPLLIRIQEEQSSISTVCRSGMTSSGSRLEKWVGFEKDIDSQSSNCKGERAGKNGSQK